MPQKSELKFSLANVHRKTRKKGKNNIIIMIASGPGEYGRFKIFYIFDFQILKTNACILCNQKVAL